MTARTLRQNLISTVAFLVIASALTLLVGIQYRSLGEASRTAVPVYIAIAAGWLTFCLQRRIAYTNALRSLWERIVETIQDALHYLALPQRTEDELRTLNRDISCRIDEVRGVFRNVGERPYRRLAETDAFVRAIKHATSIEAVGNVAGGFEQKWKRGVYPFESLKQIRNVILLLGYGEAATPEKAAVARTSILKLWGVLRAQLLKELDRDHPEFPDTPYIQGDHAASVRPDVLRAAARLDLALAEQKKQL